MPDDEEPEGDAKSEVFILTGIFKNLLGFVNAKKI